MLKNYTNNNEKQLTNSTYSSIAFANPDSGIMPTRLSISYFNKLMKIGIALRNNVGGNAKFATYDTENQVVVYVSNTKAYILYMLINKFRNDDSVKNVCIELKNGLLKISDGSEYGVKNTCISISYADDSGSVNEIVYECKTDFYTGAYNYFDGKFSTQSFPNAELETFQMTLYEYYKASSYAIAATVMEASMYKRNSTYELLKSIADKVGANSKQQYNSKTFLSNSDSSNASDSVNQNAEYTLTSFENIITG